MPPFARRQRHHQLQIVPIERIAAQIYVIRRQSVMLDTDRFPEDLMFQISKKELKNWRLRFVISNPAAKMSLRRQPYAFTEHGVAMTASVLRSKRVIEVNIAIMRPFIRGCRTPTAISVRRGTHDI